MLDWRSAASLRQEGANVQGDGSALSASRSASLKLWDLSVLCEVRALARSRWRKLTCVPSQGTSGRTLRRLPILAHSRYLGGSGVTSCDAWLDAMHRAVTDSQGEMARTAKGSAN